MREQPSNVVLTPELFVVPGGAQPLLYAPLKGMVLRVKPAFLGRLRRSFGTDGRFIRDDSPLRALLNRLGLLDPADRPLTIPERAVDAPFEPTGVILLISSMCNLRCRYCYAEAGDQKRTRFRQEVAEAGIRLAVDNALRIGEDTAYVAFHGGGEPTQDMRLLRHSVAFAREYARRTSGGRLRISARLATNGFISQRTVDWIAENIDSVQVSLDGPADIHDRQRPCLNGRSTHERVVSTIKQLEGRVSDLMIKATISKASVGRMVEISEFMCRTFSLRRFHFGPVLSTGRGRSNEFGQPDAQDFVDGYIGAQRVADSWGREIVVSGGGWRRSLRYGLLIVV